MNYLHDKKVKNKKLATILIGCVFLVFVFYLRVGIFHGLSYGASVVFRPFIFLANKVGDTLTSTGTFFRSKTILQKENEDLKFQLDQMSARVANYSSVLDERNKMTEILGRKNSTVSMIIAGILSKPSQSVYDTLLIDAGANDGIVSGKKVFAYGNLPIGKVADVFSDSAKVVLFSTPKEKTDVVVSGKDVFLQAVGRGGGNFEIILPRDFVLDAGAEIDLPGIHPYILGYVASIISDPRDSYQKALVRSSVNIFELKLVEVEK